MEIKFRESLNLYLKLGKVSEARTAFQGKNYRDLILGNLYENEFVKSLRSRRPFGVSCSNNQDGSLLRNHLLRKPLWSCATKRPKGPNVCQTLRPPWDLTLPSGGREAVCKWTKSPLPAALAPSLSHQSQARTQPFFWTYCTGREGSSRRSSAARARPASSARPPAARPGKPSLLSATQRPHSRRSPRPSYNSFRVRTT